MGVSSTRSLAAAGAVSKAAVWGGAANSGRSASDSPTTAVFPSVPETRPREKPAQATKKRMIIISIRFMATMGSGLSVLGYGFASSQAATKDRNLLPTTLNLQPHQLNNEFT